MRVVLDTNIIVSAYMVARGAPARILAAWRAHRFDLVVSPALLAEYERTLKYEPLRRRHGFSPEQIDRDVEDFRRFGILVEPTQVPAVIGADPDDDNVLACATTGRAGYIVSDDAHLLALGEYQSIRILGPKAFVALLHENAG